VRVEWIGADALNVVYRSTDGPAEVLLFRDAEPRLELVQATRAFSFDGDGEAFRVASEAQRIRLAHLFDPYLAVHSSRIEALPHQITAVYGELLPRQPLRFLLADDPGAGKTIMAGLLIKELIIRGDLERCLVIAPGNLVEQWQDELKEKFDLTFDIVSREQIETSVTGNPFVERSQLIMRLDMAARSETLQAKLQAAPDWDLVVCDPSIFRSAMRPRQHTWWTAKAILATKSMSSSSTGSTRHSSSISRSRRLCRPRASTLCSKQSSR
jgi:SNF2 family DNA or RNA helicase